MRVEVITDLLEPSTGMVHGMEVMTCFLEPSTGTDAQMHLITNLHIAVQIFQG